MARKLRETGLELVLGYIDATNPEDDQIEALNQKIEAWIDQATSAPLIEVDQDVLLRFANSKALEVLSSIRHPGDLRDRIDEYRRKVEVAGIYVDSERDREEPGVACAQHLPGLLLVRDKIGGARSFYEIRLQIMALSVQLSRKPRLVIMPYEQEHLIYKQVTAILDLVAASKLNREDLMKTIDEVKANVGDALGAAVRMALRNRYDERTRDYAI
jgi:hypothetical protein